MLMIETKILPQDLAFHKALMKIFKITSKPQTYGVRSEFNSNSNPKNLSRNDTHEDCFNVLLSENGTHRRVSNKAENFYQQFMPKSDSLSSFFFSLLKIYERMNLK